MIILILCVSFFGVLSSSVSAQNDELFYVKISDDLNNVLSNMNEDESIQVFVFLQDVDIIDVMQEFQKEYPDEYGAYLDARNQDNNTIDVPVINASIYEKDGYDFKTSKIITDKDLLLQRSIEKKRQIYGNKYLANNRSVINKYCKTDEVVFCSEYAPLAILNITKQTILNLAEDSDTVLISRCIEYKNVNHNSSLSIANQVTRADYVRDYYGNAGSGVKIGQIEAEWGIPNINDPDLQNSSITLGYGGNVSEHATNVAKVLVAQNNSYGNNGLAPDAMLYSTGYSDEASFYVGIEWLLNQGVNVINCSAGCLNGGTYDTKCEYIDHIATNHDVHFVASSGNQDPYVNSPGMAYNAITVGAFDDLGTPLVHSDDILWSGSNYEETSGGARPEKPNLVAPGVHIFPWGSNPQMDMGTGTSFSAPQVTGTIAQLCSYQSALKVKQTTIGAILLASSARKVQGALGTGDIGDYFNTLVPRVQNNPQLSDKEGVGKLDSRYARGIVSYNHCWSYTISSSSFPYSKLVYINASTNSLTRIAIFWLKRNAYSLSDLDLAIKDPNGNAIPTAISTLNNNNYEIVQFIPSISGNYSIIITRSSGSSDKDFIGIAVW